MSDEADPEMRQLAREEFEEASSKLPGLEEEIKLLLVPADPDDSKNAIVEIRGGTGGDEAALLQATFFVCIRDMRRRKAGSWPCRAFPEGAAGGFKEIIFSLTGEGVYGIMKYESGVHRVQRVPATETQGRVRTSAATVAVLPEAEDFEVEIHEGEIRWDTFRSGGAGGERQQSGVRCPSALQLAQSEHRDCGRDSDRVHPRRGISPRTRSALCRGSAPSYMTGSIENISMI